MAAARRSRTTTMRRTGELEPGRSPTDTFMQPNA